MLDSTTEREELRNLPFWLVNVPHDHWPPECPEFLIGLSEKDKRIIGTRDEDYRRQTWEECMKIIRTNRIGDFHRVPSDLRRYREYTTKLTREYGSILNFILEERLRWIDIRPKGPPFSDPDDIKILYNDWPYGLAENIVHLVVWTKFDLPEDPATGDLTEAARKEIDGFVTATFRTKLKPENVAWFKNWAALKSVHAVEHFHVLLLDPDMAFVARITNGDVPLSAKVAAGS